MENPPLGAEDWQFERVARMQEAVAAFEAAPKEQPISDMQVVILYKANVERVEHHTVAGEHLFQFARPKVNDPTCMECYELSRNAHAIRDQFLNVKEWHEAYDFLLNSGRFSPLNMRLTFSEFRRWQRFAELVKLHSSLADATNEAQLSGECSEVLRALSGNYPSSFFDIPKPPDEADSRAQLLHDYPEAAPEIQEGMRVQERRRRELWSWFRQPPCSIEWIPRSREAEQRAMQHFTSKGIGPWMMEFLLPKTELRPVILIRPTYTLQAIAAANYADRIQGVEWRKCKWEKCPETFRVGSRKNQRFCIERSCRENYRSNRKRHPEAE